MADLIAQCPDCKRNQAARIGYADTPKRVCTYCGSRSLVFIRPTGVRYG